MDKFKLITGHDSKTKISMLAEGHITNDQFTTLISPLLSGNPRIKITDGNRMFVCTNGVYGLHYPMLRVCDDNNTLNDFWCMMTRKDSAGHHIMNRELKFWCNDGNDLFKLFRPLICVELMTANKTKTLILRLGAPLP